MLASKVISQSFQLPEVGMVYSNNYTKSFNA